ncbi:heat shock 70 kDa protein 12A-like isoform X2 [Dreissena polymorpha]|nr:heat shock 70 kDa protein 12A-like isoform X2 [Dreissena polymorpha]
MLPSTSTLKVTPVPVMAKAVDKTTPCLVVAIDIGSFASGYAWLWRWAYEETPLAVQTNPHWQHGSRVSQKTLTALLLKPDKTIAAFGYVAIEKLCTLEQNHKDHEDWYFFQGFKMTLHRKKECVDFNQTIEDYKGRHLPASFVFGCVITYFKEHALSHFKVNNADYRDYRESETKWVVTIPAIWTDSAKSIMREAARQANIRDSNLTIALEPECAAIYCQKLPHGQFLVTAKNLDKKYAFEPGSTVMVVDMGGGTVDITTVEVNADSSLKHVHKSGGGAWGGMRVNDEVFNMLLGVFGHEIFDVFQVKNKMDFIDMQMDVETQKRQVGPHNEQEYFRVQISQELVLLFKQIKGEKFKEVLEASGLSFMNSRLYIPIQKVFAFFNIVIKDICEFITDILEQMQLIHQVTAVVVVGGFANSNYVTDAIRDNLASRSIPVIRPDDAELSILKGAVLFGHNEAIVTSRIMPRTYGVACTMEYDKKRHNKDLTFRDGGKVWANTVFRKHVTIGQSVTCGEWIVDKDYYPADANQTVATIYMFSSDKTDPSHTTDEGCIFIGQFDVDFPPRDDERNVNRAVSVSMRFGGTEIEVKATNTTTGKTYFKYLKM